MFGMSRRALFAAAGMLAIPSRLAAAAPAPPIVSRITLAHGRVWLNLTIGGAGPFPFILDTGADVSAIDPRLAAQLHLGKVGYKGLTGIGGRVELDFYRARDVVFGGGVRQHEAVFGGLLAGKGAGEGAGLVAAGVVTTRDSDLDFVAGEWRLYPNGRPDRDGFTRLASTIGGPNRFSSDKVTVLAILDGRHTGLLADTGAQGEVLLFPAAVRRSGLWEDTRPFAPVRLRGIGGTADRVGRVVRARQLTLGTCLFDAPLVHLYDPNDEAQSLHDGLLGLPVLERLHLSTEVRAAKLWVQANGRPKPPEHYGYSGLWLDQLTGDRARVAMLSPASPAADAGLVQNDVLRAPDWPGLLRRLGGPPGGEVAVTVETPGGLSPRIIRLRAYL